MFLQDSDGAGTASGDDDSDADSDGYGEEGLSWEAVMESLQVRAVTLLFRNRDCRLLCLHPSTLSYRCNMSWCNVTIFFTSKAVERW